MMEKRLIKGLLFQGLLFLSAFVLIGCAHRVEFRSPGMYHYANPVPLKAVFYMDETMKDKTWSGRAASSGIVHRWDVPVGKIVSQYVNAYLKQAFKEFDETEVLSPKATYDILIKVIDVNYYMARQAAHCDLTFGIEDPLGKQMFNKKYHEDGPSEFQRVFAGGAFEQKSAIRESTQVVLDAILRRLVVDIQTHYKDWSVPQPQFRTSLQPGDTSRAQLVSASEYNRRGFEYYKNAQYNQAIEDFTTAISMDIKPSYATYINRGICFYELKQYDKAIADLKQAINIAPNEPSGYSWCGSVYYAIGSYREASEYFSKAIAINPNKAVYYLNRGYANSKIGNRSMALSDFKKACELGNREGCNQAEKR
jgi:tetratricopeptide (TPR) repeat protein